MAEKEWYEEKWATDIGGAIVGSIFAQPEPSIWAGYQLPAISTDLGAEYETKFKIGDWTIAAIVISIIALILLFLFSQKKGRRRVR